jgi:hypothetical protein
MRQGKPITQIVSLAVQSAGVRHQRVTTSPPRSRNLVESLCHTQNVAYEREKMYQRDCFTVDETHRHMGENTMLLKFAQSGLGCGSWKRSDCNTEAEQETTRLGQKVLGGFDVTAGEGRCFPTLLLTEVAITCFFSPAPAIRLTQNLSCLLFCTLLYSPRSYAIMSTFMMRTFKLI